MVSLGRPLAPKRELGGPHESKRPNRETRRTDLVHNIRAKDQRPFQLQADRDQTLDDSSAIELVAMLRVCKRHDRAVYCAEFRHRSGHHPALIGAKGIGRRKERREAVWRTSERARGITTRFAHKAAVTPPVTRTNRRCHEFQARIRTR